MRKKREERKERRPAVELLMLLPMRSFEASWKVIYVTEERQTFRSRWQRKRILARRFINDGIHEIDSSQAERNVNSKERCHCEVSP